MIDPADGEAAAWEREGTLQVEVHLGGIGGDGGAPRDCRGTTRHRDARSRPLEDIVDDAHLLHVAEGTGGLVEPDAGRRQLQLFSEVLT